MTITAPIAPAGHLEDEVPSRLSRLVFQAKRSLLCVRRWASDLNAGAPRHGRAPAEPGFAHVAGLSRTLLWTETVEAERRLELGKVQNLAVAASFLDGVVIPAGGVFSFWRQVGPPTPRRGFARGRMLQQGCMVASVGGGLCQLSNGLYEAALQAGCVIVERHRHSRAVPGSRAQLGRDATVAWNYVDLQFRTPVAMRLSVLVDDQALSVTLSRETPADPVSFEALDAEVDGRLALASSCGTCGKTTCDLHEGD